MCWCCTRLTGCLLHIIIFGLIRAELQLWRPGFWIWLFILCREESKRASRQADPYYMNLTPYLMAFLFDAHNHIHMSVTGGIVPTPCHMDPDIQSEHDAIETHGKAIAEHIRRTYDDAHHETIPKITTKYPIRGMALMSTQPRDFSFVSRLSKSLANQLALDMIPCFGIHPWFLHVANSDFPLVNTASETTLQDNELTCSHQRRLQNLQVKFGWYNYLAQQLRRNPLSQYV